MRSVSLMIALTRTCFPPVASFPRRMALESASDSATGMLREHLAGEILSSRQRCLASSTTPSMYSTSLGICRSNATLDSAIKSSLARAPGVGDLEQGIELGELE